MFTMLAPDTVFENEREPSNKRQVLTTYVKQYVDFMRDMVNAFYAEELYDLAFCCATFPKPSMSSNTDGEPIIKRNHDWVERCIANLNKVLVERYNFTPVEQFTLVSPL